MRAVFVLLPLCMGSIAAEPIAAQIKGQHYAFLVGCSDYSVAINAPRPQPFAPDASNGNNANRPPLTSSAANNAFGGAVDNAGLGNPNTITNGGGPRPTASPGVLRPR